MFPENLNHQ